MDAPRWHQRFGQFRRTLALFKAIDTEGRNRTLSDAEKAGLVQFFELTVALGWNTLGSYLKSQGLDVPIAPLPVFRAALAADLIADGDLWMEAVKRRNIMSHVYDVTAFDVLVIDAGELFMPIFDALEETFSAMPTAEPGE